MSNYQQPDYRVPQTDPRVGVQVEATLNPLVITAPVAKFTQPGTSSSGVETVKSVPASQLADAMGKSKKTFADGTSSST